MFEYVQTLVGIFDLLFKPSTSRDVQDNWLNAS